jgi:hypothetical protein
MAVLAVSALGLRAGPVHAQGRGGAAAVAPGRAPLLHVRLVDQETRQPLAGVLVSAFGVNGTTGPALLSSAEGIAAVRTMGAGAPRLFIRRIGFAPVTTQPVAMPADPSQLVDVTVPVHRIVLSTVRVVGSPVCTAQTASPSAGAAAAWTEVRTALEASVLTRDQRLVTTAALRFERQLGRDGALQSVDTTARGRSGERPFFAPPPAVLESDGSVTLPTMSRPSRSMLAAATCRSACSSMTPSAA